MKQPSKPTRAQKEIISNNNLVPDHWMVISESRDTLEIISRRSSRRKVLIFKVIAFIIILSIIKEMDEAKEKKDLCDIVYWGILMTITIMVMGWA